MSKNDKSQKQQVLSELSQLLESIEYFWQDQEKRDKLLSSLAQLLKADFWTHFSATSTCFFSLSNKVIKVQSISQFKLYAYAMQRVLEQEKYKNRKDLENYTLSAQNTGHLVLVLDHLRSAHNVGSIVRTAECLGVKELVLTDIARAQKMKIFKASMGAEKSIQISSFSDVTLALDFYKKQSYEIIALKPQKSKCFT